jgi:hypothetical protein
MPSIAALLRVLFLLASLLATTAQATIPTAERNLLMTFYTQTHGESWTNNSGWNGAVDTECGWHGVTCDSGNTHVLQIFLQANNLGGSLPSNLSDLSALQFFIVPGNHIGGNIPPLSGWSNLFHFDVSSNQLTGSIPALTGTSLSYVDVSGNQLTGPITPLTGATSLSYFFASSNQLTGGIPDLSGMPVLQELNVHDNQLTGSIPALSASTALLVFIVYNNQFTGPAPAVPSSDNLLAGASQLCPNFLDPSTGSTNDLAWNAATGVSPWSQQCTAAVQAVSANPASVAFGSQTVATTSATRTVTFTSSGTVTATVGLIQIIGANAGDFAITANSCTPIPLALPPSQTCTVTLTFTPGASGSRVATLSVTSSDPASPLQVGLSGTGTVTTVANVPTLSDWAMIGLNLMLALGVLAGMNRKEMKSCD